LLKLPKVELLCVKVCSLKNEVIDSWPAMLWCLRYDSASMRVPYRYANIDDIFIMQRDVASWNINVDADNER
jgi:hypothetical protein